MALSDAPSARGLIKVVTVSETRCSSRITRSAAKIQASRFYLQEILNKKVRKEPTDLYFNQRKLFEAHWSTHTHTHTHTRTP